MQRATTPTTLYEDEAVRSIELCRDLIETLRSESYTRQTQAEVEVTLPARTYFFNKLRQQRGVNNEVMANAFPSVQRATESLPTTRTDRDKITDLRFVTRRVRGQSSVTVTNWKNTRADLIVDLQRLVGALEATHEIADLQAAYRQFCRSASAHEIATLLYFTGRQYGGNSSVDWTQYW